MLQSILEGISQSAASVTTAEFFWCTAASLVLGVLAALLFMFRNEEYSSSLSVTLALLPLVVQVVILLVNGNLGAGVAVMGTFSLVRFRSAAGSARESWLSGVCGRRDLYWLRRLKCHPRRETELWHLA